MKQRSNELAVAGGFVHSQAEINILAMMLQDRKLASSIAQTYTFSLESGDVPMTPDYFSNPGRRLIFEALCQLAGNGDCEYTYEQIASRAISIALVNKHPQDAAPITRDYVQSLRNIVVADGPATVRALSAMESRRKLVGIADWLLRANTPDSDPQGVMAQLEERLHDSRPAAADQRFIAGYQAMDKHMRELAERRALFDQGIVPGISYPWPTWNANLIPHVSGKYMLLVMPQNHGKTTVGSCFGEYTASLKLHTVFVHTEDTQPSLMNRQTCRWASIPLAKLRSGNLSDDDMRRIVYAKDKYVSRFYNHLHFLNGSGMTMSELVYHLLLRKKRGECDVVFIDYMEAISPPSSRRGDYREQGAEYRDLVAFSNQQDVPVVALDQVKDGEDEIYKRGHMAMSDLRGYKEKSHSAAFILGGFRTKAGDEPIYHGGIEIAAPFEMSPITPFATLKANDNGHTRFEMAIDGPRYRACEKQEYIDNLKARLQIDDAPI